MTIATASQPNSPCTPGRLSVARAAVPTRSATRTWLTTIAHHVVGNEYRRRHRSRSLETRLASASNGDDGSQQRVRETVRTMPEADRHILYLTYWVGLSAAEVAQVLRISVPASWARVNRARRRLRTLLMEEPD